MFRPRSCCALAGLLMLNVVPALYAQKSDDKPARQWLVDRTLTLSPAAAPVPALKYRLFPSSFERKEGNAVPIYLRFAHERRDETKKQLQEKPDEWNRLPLDRLPLAEAKRFLEGYRYNLRQLELGARRKTADWGYTLDAGNPVELLLPDIQEMRMHANLLLLKARVEIVEGRLDDAVRTLETGFSFAQQLSEAPFLISSLIGVAVATKFANGLLDLMERADAPNLYWALAVLPRPLMDLRRAYELEQQMLELQFPDLADLDRPRSSEEWDATLRRIRTEVERIQKWDKSYKGPPSGRAAADPASKSPDLPAARKYLTRAARIPSAKVQAMPDAQVLLLYLSHYYHELRDEMFKLGYLPFLQSQALSEEVEQRFKSAPQSEATLLARLLMPTLRRVAQAQTRLERILAALRAIEALRMHAAAHDGQLPDRLDQVTIVPVPSDPGTGKAFQYQREGDTATLISLVPDEPREFSALRYRLKMRK